MYAGPQSLLCLLVLLFMSIASTSVVITSDQGVRGGKVIPLKETVDDAIRGLDYIRRVFVAQRTGANVNMQNGRDVLLQDVRQM